ncbi:MAG TPA: glycosyltransferase family 39 protein, partial [Terriglobales bacterium]
MNNPSRGIGLTKSETSDRLTAGLLLLLMAVLAGGAALRESVTIDELAHIAAGVSYLQKLDMRMNEEHPPLAKVIAAIPLVIRRAHADYSHLSWTFSEKLFHQLLGEWVFGHWFLMRWNDPKSTLLWARLPMLLLTLLLGAVLYRIAERLGGKWGGLLCLTAYVATPAFLTFGPLVLTDLAVTLFWVLTSWQLAQMWQLPKRKTLINFGLVFAGALLTKFSSGLLFFVFLAVAVSMRLRPLPEQPTGKIERRSWRRRGWWNFAKGTSWAALFVYLTYFFLSWNEPSDSLSLIHFPASPVLRRLFMPVWLYVRGLGLFAASAGSRPTYILGHAYPHGVWFYFPVLFLLKSQLAFLALAVLAVVVAVAAKRIGRAELPPIPGGMELRWRCLWISLVIFTAACLLSRLDISIRHFLISIALITILLAPLPRMLQNLRNFAPTVAKIGIGLAFVLALSMLVTAIVAYPNYLPYVNSLSMGRPG